MTTSVAATIEDVTPAWLSAALAGSSSGEVVVTTIAAERIGTGQIGASYRITPTYATPVDLPATFVVKIADGDRAIRERVSGGFVKEVGFYTHVAGTVAVRAPRCWHAALADDATDFSLLLDDLAPSVPGVQHRGCTPEQAADALVNLAGLHGPRWNDETLLGHGFLAPIDDEMAAFLGAVFADACGGFIERYRGRLSADDVATLEIAATRLADWLSARQGPFAVTHGDYRLDNLMFPVDGPGVAALDWQTVGVGPPMRDVAYFLGNSLDTELRRAHESALLTTYLSALEAHGIGYERASAEADYRLGHLQGPMITVLGCMFATAVPTAASDEMFMAMTARSCAAIRDHDTLGAFATS